MERRLIPTGGQTVLRTTRYGETAADYVSLSSGTPSTPSPNPKRAKTGPTDDMDVESYGYQSSESPSRLPNTRNSPLSNTSPPQVSYASALTRKGKGKQEDQLNDSSLLSRTWCKLQEFEETRTPPVTDVQYSVWLDMRNLYEDLAAVYRFAATNPYVAGLSHRPVPKWMELYCKAQKHMEELLQGTWTIGDSEVKFIKAKKLAGSRIFLKLTNVTPCHSEEEIREHIAKALLPYGTPGAIEPHYIIDFTNEFPEVNLCTRRWDAELFIPESTRLIMEPVPEILGTQTVIYWKGQSPVCHDCKVIGHWKKSCNSTLRALAHANKLAKIPPAPIQIEALNKDQPEKETTPETTPEEVAESSTKEPPKAPTAPIPPAPKKQPVQPVLPKPATTIVRESEIIQQSRQINVATGSAPSNETIVLRDTEGWTTVDSSRKKKTTAAKRKARRDNQTGSGTETKTVKKANLASTAIEVSNRPRTVGNQLQYYLYMLEQGHIIQRELQTYINKADAVTFITATKPSMKPKSYEQFTNWVGRRRRLGKTDQDDLQDIAKWKVSIPDFMNPTNPAYVDTSISAKQYNEREEQRKAKPGKLSVTLPAALSPMETEQTQEVTFRPKDKMTTVLKNIKKAFKIGFQIELVNENRELHLTSLS